MDNVQFYLTFGEIRNDLSPLVFLNPAWRNYNSTKIFIGVNTECPKKNYALFDFM